MSRPARSSATTNAKPRRASPDAGERFHGHLTALANDQTLTKKHRDHALTGDSKDHRDCHIKPDLILIYRKLDDAVLQLVRLGSHSELGL